MAALNALGQKFFHLVLVKAYRAVVAVLLVGDIMRAHFAVVHSRPLIVLVVAERHIVVKLLKHLLLGGCNAVQAVNRVGHKALLNARFHHAYHGVVVAVEIIDDDGLSTIDKEVILDWVNTHLDELNQIFITGDAFKISGYTGD